jgi:hypothetical protein
MDTKETSQDGAFIDIDLSPSQMNSKDKQHNQPDPGFQATSGMLYTPPTWGTIVSESSLTPVIENNGSAVPVADNRSVAYQQPSQSHRKSDWCCSCNCNCGSACWSCLGGCLEFLGDCLVCCWLLELCVACGS